MTVKSSIRITLSIDIDIDAWRREYGQPKSSITDIREAVRADIEQAARQAYPVSTFGSMVLVRTADR